MWSRYHAVEKQHLLNLGNIKVLKDTLKSLQDTEYNNHTKRDCLRVVLVFRQKLSGKVFFFFCHLIVMFCSLMLQGAAGSFVPVITPNRRTNRGIMYFKWLFKRLCDVQLFDSVFACLSLSRQSPVSVPHRIRSTSRSTREGKTLSEINCEFQNKQIPCQTYTSTEFPASYLCLCCVVDENYIKLKSFISIFLCLCLYVLQLVR